MEPRFQGTVNAIIEAIRQNADNKRVAIQQKQQADEAKVRQQEADIRQQQLDRLTEQYKQDHELAQQYADLARQKTGADITTAHLGNIKAATDIARSTPNGNDLLNQIPGFSNIKFPSMEDLQAQEAKRIHDQSAAQSGGAAEGALPSELQKMATANDYEGARQKAQNQQQLDILSRDQAFKAAQGAFERANQLDVAKLSRGTQMSIAQMENQTKLMGIGAEYGIDPGQAAELQRDIFSGGQKIDLKNPVMRRLVASGNEQGFKDPGEDIDVLKTLSGTEAALEKYKEFSKQLSNNKPGAILQKAGTSMLGNTSDLQTAYDETKGYLQSLGKNLEGYPGSRPLSSQYGAEVATVPGPGNTQQQARDKIAALQALVDNERDKRTANYSPQQLEMWKNKNPAINLGPSAEQRLQEYQKKQPPSLANPSAAPAAQAPPTSTNPNYVYMKDLLGGQH